MSQVAAPADRRFRRHHVKPARHRRTWRALIGPAIIAACLLVVAAFALLRGRTLLARVGMLQVDRISVHGNERLSKGEVEGMLNGLRGQSLFGTDLDVWRNRLMASPWVRDAALRRSLPSTVDVAISERTPVGVSRVGEAMYLVDERGILIDQYGPQYADLDLPLIDGLAMPSSDGSAADTGRAELASRIRQTLQTRTQISLGELLASHPLRRGLAELVAYLSLAADDAHATIDDEQRQDVLWTDATGGERHATVPLVIYSR